MSERRPRSSRHRTPDPAHVAATRKQHMLLLSLLVVIVFASVLGGGFVWSDREDLLQGAHRIDSIADIGAAVSQSRDAFRAQTLGGQADPAAGSWQPLVVLSNTLSWALWGEAAMLWHAENLVLHIALVIGLYGLGRHLLSHRRHGNRVAAWAAALYAVHPATVSSVAWIGGRTYILAALFSAWTLVAFTRLQATTRSRRGHVNRWLIGLWLLSTAAMLAHESAMMLPLVAMLVAMFESSERGRHPLAGISPRRWKGLAVLSASVLLVVLYRQLVLGGVGFAADYPAAGFFDNLGTGLRHLWFLISEAVWPSEPILSDAFRITRGWSAGEVAALLGTLLILAAVVIGFVARHPAALGASWFLLWMIPGVGVFPNQHYHDVHTLYLATWGVAFALAFTVLQFWRPVGRQLVPGSEAIAFVPVILVLALITSFSNVRWWDHKALFESEIASDPHYMEGRLELAKHAMQHDDPTTAANHLAAAIEGSRDKQFTGHWSERDALLLLGRARSAINLHAAAVQSLNEALAVSPRDAEVTYWLGVAELAQRRYVEAERWLREALRLQPDMAAAQADLGVALAGQERYVEASTLLAGALDAGLGDARRHRAMALTYLDGDRLEDAARQLRRSLALHDDATERARLAWVYWRLGNHEQAINELDVATGASEGPNDYIEWVRAQLHAATGEGGAG